MKIAVMRYSVPALAAAAALGVWSARGTPPFILPGEPPYQTGCVAVDLTTIEGFVTNPGTSLVQINGMVSFSFTVANSMSRPAVQIQAIAAIPPGRTVSIGRARLLRSLLANETCHLDVSGAIRSG